jgi:hypothetical protein
MVGVFDGDAVGAACGDVVGAALIVVGTADTGAGVAGGELVAVVAVTNVLVMMVLVSMVRVSVVDERTPSGSPGVTVVPVRTVLVSTVLVRMVLVHTMSVGAIVGAAVMVHISHPGHAVLTACLVFSSLSEEEQKAWLLAPASYVAHPP